MAPVRDLTPGGADPSDEIELRDRRPEGGAWRADALAGSPHTRLANEIATPLDDFDPEHAREFCARLCRDLLGDYAPALLLLTPGERLRLQALAAYARTLFDFAAQRGLAGERLAQINRWEFALESALAGQPIGQPVFVAMAAGELQDPWPRAALDDLAAAARRRAVAAERPSWNEADDRRLGRDLVERLARHGASGRYARVLRYLDLADAARQSGGAFGLLARLAALVRARFGVSSR